MRSSRLSRLQVMEKVQVHNKDTATDDTESHIETNASGLGSTSQGFPQRSQSTGEPWKKAVKRLYRTIISVSDDKSRFTNPEEALNALLDAVESNENITGEELINNLHRGRADTPSVDSATIQKEPATIRKVGRGSPKLVTIDSSSDEYSDAENLDGDKEHQLLEQLTNVGKVLEEEGADVVKDFDNILFRKPTVSGKLQSAMEYGVRKLQDQWDVILNVLMPQQQLQTLIFISIINIISVKRVFSVLPLVVCYASFFVMVYSTLGMFGSRTWIKRAENWRRLLRIFQSSKNKPTPTASSEDEAFYSWKSTEPYVTFFISLALFVFSLSLIGGTKEGVVALPNSWSMCSVSIFFVILCFVALADRHDKWAMVVMALDVFSSAPAIMSKLGLRSNEIPVMKYFLANWDVYQLGLVHVQLGLPSLAVLVTVIIYGTMILASPRRDIYAVIVPHIVCIAWWHTSLELFLVNDGYLGLSSLKWSDVALTLGIIWFITFPTVAALMVILAIVIVQMRHIFDSISLIKTALTATILLLPFAYRKLRDLAQKKAWSSAVSKEGKIHVKRTVLALIVYGLVVFTAAALLYESRISTDVKGGKLAKGLLWTRYEQYCAYDDENLENRLRQQIACSQLQGKAVQWRGTVQGVRIVKIDNVFETVLSYLPEELATRLRCVYGETQNDTSTAGTVIHGLENYDCTLSKHNVYTFEIDAAGPWGQQTLSSAKGSVVLVASSEFQNLVKEFEQGDVIEFIASFIPDSILKYPPKLSVISFQCLACQHVSIDKHATRYIASYGDTIWAKLFNACCFLFNFICSPLFVI